MVSIACVNAVRVTTPLRTTSRVPSANRAHRLESAMGSSGGVSMITQSN